MTHDFAQSLAATHTQELDDFWRLNLTVHFRAREVDKVTNIDDQLAGVDWRVTLPSWRTVSIDDKNRWKNQKTGRIYEDILLEFLSSRDEEAVGWCANKRYRAEYVAYCIHPLRRVYYLPLMETQRAWEQYGDQWKKKYGTRECESERNGHVWTTVNCPVPPRVLYPAIGEQFRVMARLVDGKPVKDPRKTP